MTRGLTIIGLAGTNGAGKDAVGLLLAQHHKYLFISVSDLIREELRRRGLPTGRENTRALSSEWRREFGLSMLIDRAMASYQHVASQYAGVVISSLRNPYEADRIHELGGSVLWVDADPEIRYARVQGSQRQGRAADDNKTFEQFLAEEQAEMQSTGDAAALDMSAVKTRSDYTIANNSSDFSKLEAALMQALDTLRNA
jgi:dephospho-CoA kinase